MKDPRTELTSSMWDEWTKMPYGDEQSSEEEIAGVLDGLSLSKNPSPDGMFVYSSGRLWIFRRLRNLWSVWESARDFEFASLLSIPRSMKGRVFFRLPNPLAIRLRDRIPASVKGSKKTEWLQGLWGSCGSLYLPRTGYYLSFRIPSKEAEERAAQLLRRMGFSIGRRHLQGKYEITLRNQQEIADMLARFHLFKTTLLLEEKAIFRSLRNQVNKLVNCDASNIRKSLEASSRQIDLARNVLGCPEYEDFPPVLQKLVSSRLANPSMTLEELGRIQSPPVSKSTIKYRWKKLEERVVPLSQRRKGASKR